MWKAGGETQEHVRSQTKPKGAVQRLCWRLANNKYRAAGKLTWVALGGVRRGEETGQKAWNTAICVGNRQWVSGNGIDKSSQSCRRNTRKKCDTGKEGESNAREGLSQRTKH